MARNSSSSDSEREAVDRRRSSSRRERIERRDSSDSEEDRRVEKKRGKIDYKDEDDGKRDNAGRRKVRETGSDRDGSDDKEEEDVRKRREEASYKDRDYERRHKSRYKEDDERRHKSRYKEDDEREGRKRDRAQDEEKDDDKKVGRREGDDNGHRRAEGEEQKYRGREEGRKREREDDGDKDDRRDRRRRTNRDEEAEDKGHRRREVEDRRERRRERDRGRERERIDEDEGKGRRSRKDESEDMRRNGIKDDERSAKEKVEDGKVNDDLKVPRLENWGRSGGVYIPPFKLARMMQEVQDKSSVEYQRMTWDALKKSINGLVNKVNATNIKNIIPELFAENLIRGRGLFCRSCMKSQMASPAFTDVFAALVAVVNTKFPEVGELLLKRIILQLQRAYKRNDKPQLLAAVKFIAHLVNQQVVHELIALELLTVLLENPTDDSVEVAVGFVTECGSILDDLCPKGLHG